MRAGLTVSIVGHAALIAWGVVALPATKPLDTSQIEAIPVDFVTVSDETSLPKGLKTADLVEDVKPPAPAPVKDEPPPLPKPTPPEPKPTPPEPAPPPPPSPPPAPEPVPQPEVKADAPPPPLQAPASAPQPHLRPARPKPQVAKKDQPFDIDKITAMLDKPPAEPAQPAPQPAADDTTATIGSLIGGSDAKMTASELDALRARLSQCWSPPIGWSDPAEVRVVVMIYLNADGTIGGDPQVLQAPGGRYAQAAPESAVRAVRRCAPYNLPPDKYEAWKQVKVTFDPTDMGGLL
jgi:outer membrane biosynthesis protein TonB